MKSVIFICLGLLMIGCSSPTKTNEVTTPTLPVLKLSLEAEPPAIAANGTSRMVIFVELLQDNLPIADSTEIILLNTMGTLGQGHLYSHSGVALDTLRSDSTAGMGWIIAYALGLRDSAEIMFTELP